jgi:hypothetical protein
MGQELASHLLLDLTAHLLGRSIRAHVQPNACGVQHRVHGHTHEWVRVVGGEHAPCSAVRVASARVPEHGVYRVALVQSQQAKHGNHGQARLEKGDVDSDDGRAAVEMHVQSACRAELFVVPSAAAVHVHRLVLATLDEMYIVALNLHAVHDA